MVVYRSRQAWSGIDGRGEFRCGKSRRFRVGSSVIPAPKGATAKTFEGLSEGFLDRLDFLSGAGLCVGFGEDFR